MRPIIISTGLASNKEIKEAINTIRKWHNKIIVLYCVSSYPAKLEEVNFNRIKELEKITKIKKYWFFRSYKRCDSIFNISDFWSVYN